MQFLEGKSVALVHEWFTAAGGSEKVFLKMSELIPHAQRYVLWRDPDALIDGQAVRQSWLAHTPLRRSKAMALPFMPLAWRTLGRARYDLVLSSSHAFAHTVKFGSSENTRYLSYVHSPARYIWSPTVDGRGSNRALAMPREVLRQTDRGMSRHVHSYAANSEEVRRRIARYWRRDARVINPPVDVEFYGDAPAHQRAQNRDYLLGVGRWIPYKNFDLMIEIADQARTPLVLAGSGPEEAHLRRLASKARVSVSFEPRPSNERLRELYWGAKGLLFPAHEDFGIIPVEAQACGAPVVGLGTGGLLETVADGVSGFLCPTTDPAQHAAAVSKLGDLDRETVRANAVQFSASVFLSKLATWIDDEVRQ